MNTAITLASIPAILALVNLAKLFGIQGRWATLLAVLLAVLLNVGTYYGGASPLYEAIASGLILGLSAAGLYDVTKEKRTPAAPSPDIAIITGQENN